MVKRRHDENRRREKIADAREAGKKSKPHLLTSSIANVFSPRFLLEAGGGLWQDGGMSKKTLAERPITSKDGKMPGAICYMPAGESWIRATVNGKPEEKRVVADAAAASRLQADLAAMQEAAALQRRARPCLFFDHLRGAAAAFPRRFYWDAARGIMLEIAEWSEAGRRAVQGKTYGYISPTFRLSREDGQVLGLLTDGVEVASLVNDPAFVTQAPIVDVAAARAEARPGVDLVNAATAEREEKNFSPQNDVEAPAPAPYNDGQPPMQLMDLDKLKQMLGLPAEADETAVEQALAALVAARDEASQRSEEGKKKQEELQAACDAKDEQLKKKDEELQASRAEAAEAFTDGLIRAGVIAPKDEERIQACRALYTANPQQARLAFAAGAPVAAGDSVLASRPEASAPAADADKTLEQMLAPDFA